MNADASLGAQNPRVKRLRVLLRDASARRADGVAVLDGPRAVAGALDRGARLLEAYCSIDAAPSARALAARAEVVHDLAPGVADRVSDVQTSAGLLALVEAPRHGLDALATGDMWLVLVRVNDPGNLGTLLRSAEAAGASGIVVGSGSVDPYNPKVLRASAGARFGVPVVEADVVTALETLAARGVRRIGATAGAGAPYDRAELPESFAFVLGHETAGFADAPIDTWVHIPMAGATESLNVAMAGTVLLFDATRRRAAGPSGLLGPSRHADNKLSGGMS